MPGEVIVITGCSAGGIGHFLCEEFAARGKTVYATARNPDKIADFGSPKVHKLRMDVTDDASVKEAISEVISREGYISILVNNAGVIGIKPLVDLDDEQVNSVFNTNVFGVLRVVRAVVPSMAKRRRGLILNIGSIVGEIPTPWNGIYCASKAALHSISGTLHMELKPFNIDVMNVAPGGIKSNLSANESKVFDLLPKDTLYSAYLPNIIDRLNASQTSSSMPTDVFAKRVVDQALGKSPPYYYTLGASSTVFWVLSWFPRWFALWALWRRFSRKN